MTYEHFNWHGATIGRNSEDDRNQSDIPPAEHWEWMEWVETGGLGPEPDFPGDER